MAFNFGSAGAGASMGASFGPIGALAGGVLGGFFGGGAPELPKELRRLYNISYRSARGLEDFSRSVPMSDPLERAALAQQRGLLGEQQRQQRDMLYASLGPMGSVAPADFLMNLTNQQVGQQSALSLQHLLNALAARRQAMMQAAPVAQGAAGSVQYQQQPRMGAEFGNLLQMLSYQQAMRNANRQQPLGGGQLGGLRWGDYGNTRTPAPAGPVGMFGFPAGMRF